MATDLATQKPFLRSDAFLKRKFAELCARVKRTDIAAHLLALGLAILTYALVIGIFDRIAGASQSAAAVGFRWIAYFVFLIGAGILVVLAVRACVRRVSPYYVAHKVEQSIPAAKNSLINWLDLHDQGLPSAFQKNLSAVAAERFEEYDVEALVPRRRNRILLGTLAALVLGLAILALLGPSLFLASMLRAFAPFYTPADLTTQLTLLEPGGNAEVGPGQGVRFAVKIEGRAPRTEPILHYRWNADDDFLLLRMDSEGGNVWSAQLSPSQLHAGVSYKVSAGDAETPIHQIRTRPAAHVQKLVVAYKHRHFQDSSAVFPDGNGTRPIIHGPAGSEVELTVHASRPVQSARVEIANKVGKQELPITRPPDDPQVFRCRFTLDKPGQLTIAFTATDGEQSIDREGILVLITEEIAPKVMPNLDSPSPQDALNKLEKERADANNKLNKAKKEEQRNHELGGAKGAVPKNSQKKEGPQDSNSQPKPSPMQSADGAGENKDAGDGKSKSGESRGDGQSQPKKDDASKGDKKDGSKGGSSPGKDSGGMGKQESPGNARPSDPMNAKGPDHPQQPKDNAAQPDAPTPSVKDSKPEPTSKDGPAQGTVKGSDKNGPDLPSKDQQAGGPMQPPDAQAKAGKGNDAGPQGKSKDGDGDPGQARGDDKKAGPGPPTWDDIARHIQNLPRDDQAGKEAGKALAAIGKAADDPRMRDIAKEALVKNGRDPKTGEKGKAPNPFGTKPGVSVGIGDDIKAAAANREFAARIGQLQLDDWRKILTPDLLKKAGMTDADWQNYVKNQAAHDALVQKLNAELALKALKKLGPAQINSATGRSADSQAGHESVRGSTAPPPDELLDAIRRKAEREKR